MISREVKLREGNPPVNIYSLPLKNILADFNNEMFRERMMIQTMVGKRPYNATREIKSPIGRRYVKV